MTPAAVVFRILNPTHRGRAGLGSPLCEAWPPICRSLSRFEFKRGKMLCRSGRDRSGDRQSATRPSGCRIVLAGLSAASFMTTGDICPASSSAAAVAPRPVSGAGSSGVLHDDRAVHVRMDRADVLVSAPLFEHEGVLLPAVDPWKSE